VLAEVVDGEQLFEVAGSALAAGVGLALFLLFCVYGFPRAHEARLNESWIAAFGFGLISAVGLVGAIAGIALG
jgi:hypothetical protein